MMKQEKGQEQMYLRLRFRSIAHRRAVEALAAKEGSSMTTVINDLITEHLLNRGKRPRWNPDI
jgi:hypothetical protein